MQRGRSWKDWQLVLLALGIIITAGIFWWEFPKRRAASAVRGSEAARRKYEDSLRDSAGKLIVGIAVAGGILVTLYQTLETHRLTINSQILDQFQKASGNLANSNLRFHSAAMLSRLISG